jgi:hypothetical protein
VQFDPRRRVLVLGSSVSWMVLRQGTDIQAGREGAAEGEGGKGRQPQAQTACVQTAGLILPHLSQ